jgi:DNA-binding NarL/FixJ family response regulator
MDKITIIVADDHAVVREGTRRLLEREPDMDLVGEAADGEEALRLINEFTPDVAIVDISMPRMSGIELPRKAKASQPATAILILTAYDNDEYVFALLEAGAAGYLLKAAPAQELVEAVRLVHSGEPVLQEIELSPREHEVLQLAAKGMTNKEIADSLCISIRTVQRHLNIMFNKLNVGSRTEAIFQSVKKGWLSFTDLG